MKEVTKEYSLDNICNLDILTNTGQKLLNSGYKIRMKDNKISPAFHAKTLNTPWIYVRPDSDKECTFWHHIIFNIYDLFPLGCLNCWKVVVRPRTIKELFMLHDYQDEVYESFCKCGLELRKYVHGNYGGYFYNNSIEEGLKCYKKVKEDLAEYISPDIPVILKRACTEFEMKYGDSSRWEEYLENGYYIDSEGNKNTIPKLDVQQQKSAVIASHYDLDHMEDDEGGIMPMEGISFLQPPYVKIAIMRTWLEHAYSVGDSTALEFNEGGKHFYTPYVTYHDKEEK